MINEEIFADLEPDDVADVIHLPDRKRIMRGSEEHDRRVAQSLGPMASRPAVSYAEPMSQAVPLLSASSIGDSPAQQPLIWTVCTCVAVIAAVTPGVTAAYVHQGGTEFVLVGPDWTAELNLLAATLAVELQSRSDPDALPRIEGSFFNWEPNVAAEWFRVYP